MRRWILTGLLGCWLGTAAMAAKAFRVEDIRVEGLQRISAGTVFNYLPVKKGERLDEALSSRALRELFETGFFKDIVLEREGNTLVLDGEVPPEMKVTWGHAFIDQRPPRVDGAARRCPRTSPVSGSV